MESLERFSDLIGVIYDAALDPLRWPQVLSGLTEAIDGTSSLFFTPMHGGDAGGFAYLNGMPETFLQQYAAKWAPHDIWMQAGVGKGLLTTGTVTTDDELVPRKQLLASEYYKGFLRSANISRVCSMAIFGADADSLRPTIVSVYKGIRARSFSAEAKAIARLLTPHLSRSLGMMYRLQDAEFRVASSRAAINRLAAPIIMLGQNGAPLFINKAAQKILDARDGLLLREAPGQSPQLAGAMPELTAQIRAVIATALQPEAAAVPHFLQGVRLSRANGRPALALSVSALPVRNEFGAGLDTPGAIAFIHDTAGPPPVSIRLLRDIYALTEAEAAVVVALCGGSSVADIARERRVSENTLKSQIDSAFTKTGTNRQADLVRVALALYSGAPPA